MQVEFQSILRMSLSFDSLSTQGTPWKLSRFKVDVVFIAFLHCGRKGGVHDSEAFTGEQ